MSSSTAEPRALDPARTRRALVVAALLALVAAPPLCAGNPFTGGGAGPEAPAVRGVTSSGPLASAQIVLRERAAAAVGAFASGGSIGSLVAFLGAAFVYGALHAAGPGHRKTVVFSLFLGRRAASWEPAAAGFLSAGIHAAAGVLVILVLSLARGAAASLGEAERVGAWLDGGTFGLLILFSLALAAAKLIRMLRSDRADPGPDKDPEEGEPSTHRAPSESRAPGLRGRKRGLYGTVAVASLVPCPGATLLLLFAIYAGHPGLGAAGVLAMSIGMGLVISAAGYLAWFGREGMFRGLKNRQALVALASDLLELVSYLAVLAFSLYVAWPFFAGLAAR